MASAAAEVAVSVQDEFKLALIAGINRRLSTLREKHSAWSGVAEELGWHAEHLSRLRTNQHDYFSLSRLIDMAEQLEVQVQLTVT